MPKLIDHSLTMSNEIEAINNRLEQLEDIETRLYLGKEATVQRRAREDEQVQLKRQEEDRGFLETLRERDQEEDVSTLRPPIRRSMVELECSGAPSETKNPLSVLF